MVAKLLSFAYSLLDVYSVEIEVDLQRGLPAVSIVGLADTAVKESRDRLRPAIKNSGFEFPGQKITINLAPGNIKKEGTHFDLAMALGIIAASNQAKLDLSPYAIIGELSLEGNVRSVKGIFPMALQAKAQGKKIILPKKNTTKAGLIKGLKIFPVNSLEETVAFLSNVIEISAYSGCIAESFSLVNNFPIDFCEIKGQLIARRAMEIAAAGMHNIILIGPPGVGKTMLAQRLPTILPDMEWEEIMEVTKIYSVAGLLNNEQPLIKQRPFRAPHHTSSAVALVGGGASIRPGEITLSHKGVLFMDELPEFHRDALEALRQPLEDGVVNIARAAKQAKFPARFLFAAAMNPCPCGYFGAGQRACNCSSFHIQKYRNKISGPLLDRIDIHAQLTGIKTDELFAVDFQTENSAMIKQRVENVRYIQKQRFSDDKILFNSQMNHRQMYKYCRMDNSAKNFLKRAIKHFDFSARAYYKILKVSRTIADLSGHDDITEEDISEAVQYRNFDKNL